MITASLVDEASSRRLYSSSVVSLARAIENSPVKTKDDRLDAIKERIQELVN
jgi:hypothetical protein